MFVVHADVRVHTAGPIWVAALALLVVLRELFCAWLVVGVSFFGIHHTFECRRLMYAPCSRDIIS